MIISRALFCIGILLSCVNLYAQDKYDVATIQPELLKNADAVVRNFDTKIDVISLNEIQVHETYAITILNKDGYTHANYRQFYDKFSSAPAIKGTLYDSKGIEIKKLKNSEIKDNAMYGESFFDDNRYKEHTFSYSNYPYTVVYESDLKYKTLVRLDEWAPQNDDNVSVENASLELNYPSEYVIKHTLYHIAQAPENKATAIGRVLKLSLKNINAVKEDPVKPFELYPYPTIVFSHDTFMFGNVTGSMQSWASLGKYSYELNKDRDVLPAKTKEIVHKLIDTCKSDYSKISVLYQYMKNTTRYVSIQLGIGGWQTFEAAFVAEKGYGDCKALSNYMKALLAEAGIRAYEVLILAGENKKVVLPKDMAYDCFNHVILCVPTSKDTTWIECTAKTIPAGYLSGFTDNRDALMVTPAGGVVVHTPVYTNQQNTIQRNAIMHINATGMLEGNIIMAYTGMAYDKEYHYYNQQTAEKIEKHLNEQFSLTSYHISNYETAESTNKCMPQLSIKAGIAGTANVQRSGKRIFFAPVIAPVTTYYSPASNTRTTPFEIPHSLQVSDTTLCIFTGSAYELESLPENTTLTYPFGSYSSKYTFENGNTVKCIRIFRQNEGVYAADNYIDYVKMMVEASSKDQQKQAVLLKKD